MPPRLNLPEMAIRDAYSNGDSVPRIATRLGVHQATVQRRLRAMGVLRTWPEAMAMTRTQLASSLLIPPLPADQRWLLGLLLTDGAICGRRQTTVMLRMKDVDGPRKAHTIVGIGNIAGRIANGRGHAPAGNRYAEWSVASIELAQRLAFWGVVSAKSLRCRCPDDLIRDPHFWRGVWDGDGSMSVSLRDNRLASPLHSGSLVFIEQACEVIRTVTGISLKPRRARASWCVHPRGGTAVLLARWLYQDSDASIRLDRKYAKARPYL